MSKEDKMNKSVRIFVIGLVLIGVTSALPLPFLKTAAAPAYVPFGNCLAYDSFNRANGNIGTTETIGPYGTVCPALPWSWANANWAIASNAASGTPGAGSELTTNTIFDSDTGWTKGTNWAISGGAANITPPGSASNLTQTTGTQSVVGSWYMGTYDVLNYSAGTVLFSIDSGGTNDTARSANGSYLFIRRAAASGRTLFQGNSDAQLSVDNASRKLLTLNTLFSAVNLSTSNVVANINVTVTANTEGGLVLNLDSASAPTNFILAYHNGTSILLDKCVGGTYTNLFTTTTTYVPGATLQVTTTRSGTDLLVDVKYNGAAVNTQKTIADSGIVDNTLLGLFSTYASNTFDSFYVTSNTANTATPSQTYTPTVSQTPTTTFTPSSTYTPTPSSTSTFTPTFTFTPSATSTHTPTPTFTPTDTPTPSATSTITLTPTITNTPTFDATAVFSQYAEIAKNSYPVVLPIAIVGVFMLLAGLIGVALWLTQRKRA
jgi:hypothetical protein